MNCLFPEYKLLKLMDIVITRLFVNAILVKFLICGGGILITFCKVFVMAAVLKSSLVLAHRHILHGWEPSTKCAIWI